MHTQQSKKYRLKWNNSFAAAAAAVVVFTAIYNLYIIHVSFNVLHSITLVEHFCLSLSHIHPWDSLVLFSYATAISWLQFFCAIHLFFSHKPVQYSSVLSCKNGKLVVFVSRFFFFKKHDTFCNEMFCFVFGFELWRPWFDWWAAGNIWMWLFYYFLLMMDGWQPMHVDMLSFYYYYGTIYINRINNIRICMVVEMQYKMLS